MKPIRPLDFWLLGFSLKMSSFFLLLSCGGLHTLTNLHNMDQGGDNGASYFSSTDKKTDILFIVDTSYSMVSHLVRADKSFNNFITNLKGSSWRLGITNADYNPQPTHFEAPHLFMGGLMPFYFSGQSLAPVLTSSMESAENIFLQTLKRPSRHSQRLLFYFNPCSEPPFCQTGVKNPIQSLMSAFSKNKSFFRTNAHLHAVIFTNGDEEHHFPGLTEKVQEEFNRHLGTKMTGLTVHGIFVVPEDTACLSYHNFKTKYDFSFARYGKHILSLVHRTGGRALSICSLNYSVLAKYL